MRSFVQAKRSGGYPVEPWRARDKKKRERQSLAFRIRFCEEERYQSGYSASSSSLTTKMWQVSSPEYERTSTPPSSSKLAIR
jgi:hypothetical protein